MKKCFSLSGFHLRIENLKVTHPNNPYNLLFVSCSSLHNFFHQIQHLICRAFKMYLILWNSGDSRQQGNFISGCRHISITHKTSQLKAHKGAPTKRSSLNFLNRRMNNTTMRREKSQKCLSHERASSSSYHILHTTVIVWKRLTWRRCKICLFSQE